MKKLAIIALAASAAIATPAMAQSVGTVIINGSVADKCSVINGVTPTTWGTTVNLGELAKADGTLKTSADLSTAFNTAAGGAQNARVVCTSANPKITVNADPLVAGTAAVTGYTNTVHFQADVTVSKATTPATTYTNDSTAAVSGPTAIGDRLAASGTNVAIATSNWRTTPSGSELLVADTNYAGQIVVTIAPL